MLDQYLAQLDKLLENQWYRTALVIGAAILLGVILRLVLVPILNRLTSKTNSKIDDKIFSRLNITLIRVLILQAAHFLIRGWIFDEHIIGLVDSLYVTLLVLYVGKALLDVSAITFQHLSEVADKYTWIQQATLPLYKFIFKVVLFALQTYIIMSAWEINLTSWLASAGVMGIAIGFAAKDTLANFISGIFILVDAPYKVGQYIYIDGQTRGVVTDIGMRSTRLLTTDNVEVTVPNGVIGNSMIINETSGPSTRMRVRSTVGVAYGSDIEVVRKLLVDCTEGMPYLEPGQNTVVRFIAMGESSLDFQILVWARHPAFRGKVIDALNTRIYIALGEAGIEIPFPQRDVNVKVWPSPPGE